jgi:5-enolpyruvylshikimate-3-phosphate synthase
MDMNHIPDAAMTIATAALFARGTTTMRNIYNWRVKETDRLLPWRQSFVKWALRWKRAKIIFA